jgi:multiple sugar transport system permease protein
MARSVDASGAAIGRGSSSWSLHLGAWAERWFRWLLVSPAILLILALSIYPLAFSLWVCFVNYDFQIPGHAFVGLQNFRAVLADPIFAASLARTAALSVMVVAIELVLGLALALAMEGRFRGRALLLLVFIVPLFVSPVIVGQFWSLLLQRPFGPANHVLGLLLGRPVEISWLTQSPWNYVAIVLADVWQWTPFMFVILLSGLAAIPSEMYEAASLDGASRWRSFRHLTLPQLTPVIMLALTFRLLDAVKLFDVIYVMTGGGPGTSTYTTSFYLYQIGFQQFHLSQATAGSWIFLVLSAVIITALVRRLLRPGVS